jgi:predicted RND superfamily exporter protein
MAGNFGWTAQTAAFLLYVEALLLMARKWETRFKPVLLVVLSVHVACGVLFALANALFPAELWA